MAAQPRRVKNIKKIHRMIKDDDRNVALGFCFPHWCKYVFRYNPLFFGFPELIAGQNKGEEREALVEALANDALFSRIMREFVPDPEIKKVDTYIKFIYDKYEKYMILPLSSVVYKEHIDFVDFLLGLILTHVVNIASFIVFFNQTRSGLAIVVTLLSFAMLFIIVFQLRYIRSTEMISKAALKGGKNRLHLLRPRFIVRVEIVVDIVVILLLFFILRIDLQIIGVLILNIYDLFSNINQLNKFDKASFKMVLIRLAIVIYYYQVYEEYPAFDHPIETTGESHLVSLGARAYAQVTELSQRYKDRYAGYREYYENERNRTLMKAITEVEEFPDNLTAMEWHQDLMGRAIYVRGESMARITPHIDDDDEEA